MPNVKTKYLKYSHWMKFLHCLKPFKVVMSIFHLHHPSNSNYTHSMVSLKNNYTNLVYCGIFLMWQHFNFCSVGLAISAFPNRDILD